VVCGEVSLRQGFAGYRYQATCREVIVDVFVMSETTHMSFILENHLASSCYQSSWI